MNTDADVDFLLFLSLLNFAVLLLFTLEGGIECIDACHWHIPAVSYFPLVLIRNIIHRHLAVTSFWLDVVEADLALSGRHIYIFFIFVVLFLTGFVLTRAKCIELFTCLILLLLFFCPSCDVRADMPFLANSHQRVDFLQIEQMASAHDR